MRGGDVPLFTKREANAGTWGSRRQAVAIAAYVEASLDGVWYDEAVVFDVMEPAYND
jgi:hypothetical protein